MRSEIQPGGQKARSFIEEARRDQIVRAAVEVIAEVGFARASLARIAQRAGISKGVISYHFAGKEELMEQVVDRVYAQIGEFVVARMEGAESAAELLRTHIVSVAEHMRANRVQLTALGEIFNNLRTTDGEPRYGVHTSEGLYQALESIYRRGQDRGEFRAFDVRVMAVTHQAAIDAMFAYWQTHPEHDLEAHARQLADLLERACT
ncbi:TetR/AcrR family transcriptional regulator [Nonomuraea roseoviolacea]|uniref:AcrR family transcriptional regulator n=1 Tax=Nonomuraea roseoviolacea subsp. carminata TaxID=160689 RepID=A0ABT1KGL7_9ACTN|nr:TetR/AcrR family transcriptional regulator [Nonomuraea roseoviolacea]MCP2352797.1 AcrR family transcriptional regulator [Nonomuraea roseoviolacea subsp. carminata]